MNPRWTVYGAAVDDWQDEEMLNDCFADLIADSLARGPEFLNFLLDDLLVFEDGAEVIATDRDPLPYRSDGATDRKIDFTVADASQIVGFESKRRDTLTRDQLAAERAKLEYNADGRDVVLVALTEHLGEPDIIAHLADTIHWGSWYALAQRAFDGDALDNEWQPTVARAQKMFRAFGYDDFNGIDDEAFRVSVWELWKQLATQIDGIDTGERWPYQTAKTALGTSSGWKPIDPDWMLLTYSAGNTGEHSETCFALLSNKRTKTVWVGLAVRPWKNEPLQDVLVDNAAALADRVHTEALDVIQFPLNWLVGRKTLPEGHQKAVTAAYPSTVDELREAFSDERGMRNDGANRFVLGYQLASDEGLEAAVEYIHQLQQLFGGDDGPELRRLVQTDG